MVLDPSKSKSSDNQECARLTYSILEKNRQVIFADLKRRTKNGEDKGFELASFFRYCFVPISEDFDCFNRSYAYRDKR